MDETFEERLGAARDELARRRDAVLSAKAARDTLLKQREELTAIVAESKRDAQTLEEVRHLFEHLTDQKRELVRTKIETLVSHGIQAVFGPDYSFSIEQDNKRNQVVFDYKILQTVSGETVVTDLRGSHGAGLLALVGFLLRLVMVLFVHPPRRRALFLDETFSNLDPDKRPALARLLQSLGTSLDCQFVLITHSPEYVDEASVAYEIQASGGSSCLNRI